jgi:DNA polymerase IV
MRKIIHIDMDAFYASVEQRDNPELRGKPIAVGGGEKRGVTTTASYETRKYGVRSAMPGYLAKQKCPEIIFVKPRFEAYKNVSRQIRKIFHQYTDLVEPLSLDEAYLDVTKNKINEPIATVIAEAIRNDIWKETQLTCSAGVSYCKFIAKVASDMNKPNGMTVIKPHQAIDFLEKLPIEKFYGIGKVTAQKMHDLNIFSGADLKKIDQLELVQKFGKSGQFYYDIVRGIDERPVKTDRHRKSLAVERTLDENIEGYEALSMEIKKIAEMLHKSIHKYQYFGRTISLKVKTSDFKIMTRSISIQEKICTLDHINQLAEGLLLLNHQVFGTVRLIGLTISNEFTQAKTNNDNQLKLL